MLLLAFGWCLASRGQRTRQAPHFPGHGPAGTGLLQNPATILRLVGYSTQSLATTERTAGKDLHMA